MLVLASQSPRRAEILRQGGIPFIVRAMAIDETTLPGELPLDYVLRLAEAKALAIDSSPDETVLAADTTVVVDEHILAKPDDAADARRMLAMLAGRGHQVITGICLKRGPRVILDSATTEVRFSGMTEDEIARYVASGEPMDKAGAYAIQGLAAKYVEGISGCYFNVMGLPLSLVFRHLRELENGHDGQPIA